MKENKCMQCAMQYGIPREKFSVERKPYTFLALQQKEGFMQEKWSLLTFTTRLCDCAIVHWQRGEQKQTLCVLGCAETLFFLELETMRKIILKTFHYFYKLAW